MPFGNTGGSTGGATTPVTFALTEQLQAAAAFDIDLASLAPSASGVGVQSAMISNAGNRPAALVFLSVQFAAAPTAGTIVDVYLLQGETTSTNTTDGASAAKGARTRVNAARIGSLTIQSGTGPVSAWFDTAALNTVLGPAWGILVVNRTNQNLHATEANHVKRYIYHNKQAA